MLDKTGYLVDNTIMLALHDIDRRFRPRWDMGEFFDMTFLQQFTAAGPTTNFMPAPGPVEAARRDTVANYTLEYLDRMREQAQGPNTQWQAPALRPQPTWDYRGFPDMGVDQRDPNRRQIEDRWNAEHELRRLRDEREMLRRENYAIREENFRLRTRDT